MNEKEEASFNQSFQISVSFLLIDRYFILLKKGKRTAPFFYKCSNKKSFTFYFIGIKPIAVSFVLC